jgi:hypothetical protein
MSLGEGNRGRCRETENDDGFFHNFAFVGSKFSHEQTSGTVGITQLGFHPKRAAFSSRNWRAIHSLSNGF